MAAQAGGGRARRSRAPPAAALVRVDGDRRRWSPTAVAHRARGRRPRPTPSCSRTWCWPPSATPCTRCSELQASAMGGLDLGALGLGGWATPTSATRRARGPRPARRPRPRLGLMATYAAPVQALIDELGRLPGIGPKSAQRIAFHLLKLPGRGRHPPGPRHHRGQGPGHASASGASTSPRAPLCPLCTDDRRDATVVCVVEDARDIVAVEKTGEFHGRYHVLLGAITPDRRHRARSAEGAGAARPPRAGGRAGGHPVHQPEHRGRGHRHVPGPPAASRSALRVTRIASGLPVGGDLEYADELTLGRALEGRREVDA